MTETGIWNQEEADKGHLFSYRLAQWIANYIIKKGGHHHQIETIFDFGSGKGAYCRYFEDRGFYTVIGIEGTKLSDLENSDTRIIDLSQQFIITRAGQVPEKPGYVISIEVGEHIPKEYEEIYINNIVNHAAKNHIIVISWAHEGQAGDGHVNCQPDWYVIKAFERKGCKFEPELTVSVRKTPEGHVAYLKENLFIFRKL